MYIKKTVQVKNKKEYYTFRLFHTYRDINTKIRNEELLNLGAYFNLHKDSWKPLCDRIQRLLNKEDDLLDFDTDQEIKTLSDKIVKNIQDKYNSRVNANKQNETSKFEYIDLHSTNDTNCNL
jgi:hypothetical protein